MKNPFSCTLTGYHWWKPFLGFFVLYLVLNTAIQNSMEVNSVVQNPSILISAILFMLVLTVILMLIEAFFYIMLYRIAFSHISFRGKPFSFTGKKGEFVSLMLVCALLLVVTLGFYLPWFMTRLTRYLAGHIQYDNAPVQFEGKPGKLLKYYLLGVILPFLAWIFSFGFIYTLAIFSGQMETEASVVLLTLLVFGSLILFFLPFTYYMYTWIVNFSWKNYHVYWKTSFWSSIFFILGQVFLVIVTLGVYIPAFVLSLLHYFINRTVLDKDGQPAGCFEFYREPGGFTFFWKQILLSLVTIGVYLPWAYANILRYVLSHTSIETTPAELPQNY